MKVQELFERSKCLPEAVELGDPFKLSPEDIAATPEVSASNINSRFRVGKVVFDQREGLGATPNNQEVDYYGCAIELKPSHFLRLATRADRSDDVKRFTKFIQDGVPLASPTLYVKINEEEWKAGAPLRFEVTGHEGRARAGAIMSINGDTRIPVHIILRGGMRARHLSEKLFNDLRDIGIYPENSNKYSTPIVKTIGRIFWNGKVL